MVSCAKDIQLRELKDTVSQLKTMIAEQTELIKALRLIIDEKTSHENSNNFALIFRYVRAAKSVESGGGIHIGVRPH